MPPKSPFVMRLSLNVLNHLGLHLYSNTPAVLSEAIANAWDADATEVRIDLDRAERTITVRDDGIGMDEDDINEKFLYVGYKRRGDEKDDKNEILTDKLRKPMGRKGIGKLSLFSIAKKIAVYSRKQGCDPVALLLDADELEKQIAADDPSERGDYEPEPIEFDRSLDPHGTALVISDLKKIRSITETTIVSLRKRIARRFNIIGDDFRVIVNGDPVTLEDRDYFHKARFIFQYGRDYSEQCPNLDRDEKLDQPSTRCGKFDAQGEPSEAGEYEARGWIAIARHSNDLDGGTTNDGDNLNKISIVVRGKVAQEDILQEFRLGGMITKFMFGEITADFLDQDGKEDIATSSRQSISEDDVRYKALKAFLSKELQHIWVATNKLKERKGLQHVLADNQPLSDWYEKLPPWLQKRAARIFAEIDKANIEESSKRDFYANGVLAFERLKLNHAIEVLDEVDESNVEELLGFLADIDAIEAARFREIIQERLVIISKLQNSVAENALERVLEEYLFNHLWLLDPAWERPLEYKSMEERLHHAASGKRVQTDIQYRRVDAAHVVVELKRGKRRLRKTSIEAQLVKYMDAVKDELKRNQEERDLPVHGVCVVGRLPVGWEDLQVRTMDERALAVYRITVVTYDEVISRAESAYKKFLRVTGELQDLSALIDAIRTYESVPATDST